MSGKHTPGPWVRKVVDHGDLKQAETIQASSVPFGRGAFPVVDPGAIGGRSLEECDANAALIAAAPDLLAVLKEQSRLIGQFLSGQLVVFPSAIRGQAEAAIAAAEGRA